MLVNLNVWDQILARVETKVNRHSFYTWFKPTSYVADGGTLITVRVPSLLFKDWLTKHYSAVLAEALADVGRPEAKVSFVAEGTAAALDPVAVAAKKPEELPGPVEPYSAGGLNL